MSSLAWLFDDRNKLNVIKRNNFPYPFPLNHRKIYFDLSHSYYNKFGSATQNTHRTNSGTLQNRAMAEGNFTFDENDTDSWYFGAIPQAEVEALLEKEEPGTFLVRDSSNTSGSYVICLREADKVYNYKVNTVVQNGHTLYKLRDDASFSDIPSLLSFYKRNLFNTTCLRKPVGSVVTRNHPAHHRYSDITSLRTKAGLSRQVRMSAPADCRVRNSRGDDNSPLYMKVTKQKIPSPYEQDKLSLKVGDVIKVTRRSGDNWEGELNGKVGLFPVSCAEFTDAPEEEDQ